MLGVKLKKKQHSEVNLQVIAAFQRNIVLTLNQLDCSLHGKSCSTVMTLCSSNKHQELHSEQLVLLFCWNSYLKKNCPVPFNDCWLPATTSSITNSFIVLSERACVHACVCLWFWQKQNKWLWHLFGVQLTSLFLIGRSSCIHFLYFRNEQ